jgi:F-type H+-transporting ATPase subunit epsilon
LRAKVLELGEKLFDGEITKIVVPSADGEMCILPNHISIVTVLKSGVMKIFRTNTDRPLVINVTGGLCSFSKNEAVFILENK